MIESHTDWLLMGVLIVVFLAIAGLIWWHRRTPTEAQKDIQGIAAEIKDLMKKLESVKPVAPPADPLFYNNIQFKTLEELTDYKLAEAKLRSYQP